MSGQTATIIVPVRNESGILMGRLKQLQTDLDFLGDRYEIVIVENGSEDVTPSLARAVQEGDRRIRVSCLDRASYAEAFRVGLQSARCEKIFWLNLDFWNKEFLIQAFKDLEEYDCIVGSKNIAGSLDDRPISRRLASKGFHFLLRLIFGWSGTDTHGIKAFRRAAVLKVLPHCRLNNDLLDTEMILRLYQSGASIKELPVRVFEIRPPRFSNLKRITGFFPDFFQLCRSLYERSPIP